jgi:hypothetical protein
MDAKIGSSSLFAPLCPLAASWEQANPTKCSAPLAPFSFISRRRLRCYRVICSPISPSVLFHLFCFPPSRIHHPDLHRATVPRIERTSMIQAIKVSPPPNPPLRHYSEKLLCKISSSPSINTLGTEWFLGNNQSHQPLLLARALSGAVSILM